VKRQEFKLVSRNGHKFPQRASLYCHS
jgi:hypothetical protein